jgi:hypothetical protein
VWSHEALTGLEARAARVVLPARCVLTLRTAAKPHESLVYVAFTDVTQTSIGILTDWLRVGHCPRSAARRANGD